MIPHSPLKSWLFLMSTGVDHLLIPDKTPRGSPAALLSLRNFFAVKRRYRKVFTSGCGKGVDGCWWMLMAPQKENHINLAGFNGFNPAEIKISSRWGLSQRWTVTGHPSNVGLCYPIDISTINIHGLVINSINQFAALYGDPCLKMCMNHGGC